MKTDYLVLGGGMAGFSAAWEIRSQDPKASITLVGAEQEPPYLRPLLSKTDFRQLQRSRLHLEEARWYTEQRIDLRLGVQVTGLELSSRTATLSNGETLSYGSCVYALGANCFVPPIPGREKAGVLTLRTLADFHKLRRCAMTARRAIIIGGGVIGMEMAWELHNMDIGCTVLEAAPRLMGRQLDPESSALLRQRVTDAGIPCHVGVQVAELTGEDQVTGVALADGRQFPADLVILSTGVRAVTDLARSAGLACDRGVLTDDTLVTSDPHVLAAGDCIQCSIPNPGLWKYARISGTIAGYNAVHRDTPKTFRVGYFPVVLSAMGIGLFALGRVEEGEGITVERRDQPPENGGVPRFLVNENEYGGLYYQKRFYENGALCGAVLMGDIHDMGEILQQMEGSAKA